MKKIHTFESFLNLNEALPDGIVRVFRTKDMKDYIKDVPEDAIKERGKDLKINFILPSFVVEKASSAEGEVSEYEFSFGGNDFMADVNVEGTVEDLGEDGVETEVDKIKIYTLYVSVLDSYLEINPLKGDMKNYKSVISKLEAHLMKDTDFMKEAKDALR